MVDEQHSTAMAAQVLAFKVSLPPIAQGTGRKKHNPCPRCGSRFYDFYKGRWKSCRTCGFDRQMHLYVSGVKWELRRGRTIEVERLQFCVDYIAALEPCR